MSVSVRVRENHKEVSIRSNMENRRTATKNAWHQPTHKTFSFLINGCFAYTVKRRCTCVSCTNAYNEFQRCNKTRWINDRIARWIIITHTHTNTYRRWPTHPLSTPFQFSFHILFFRFIFIYIWMCMHTNIFVVLLLHSFVQFSFNLLVKATGLCTLCRI